MEENIKITIRKEDSEISNNLILAFSRQALLMFNILLGGTSRKVHVLFILIKDVV